KDELRAELARGIARVEDRIDLHDVDRGQQLRVRHDLQAEVRLAVGQPALFRRPYPQRLARVDRIDVEADVNARRAARGPLDRLVDDMRHAVTVDVLHGEYRDAAVGDQLLFPLVEIPD